MQKNVASQHIALFAFDATTGLGKGGDGGNITPYVSKDYGTVTALGTATATEMDATNAKGWYSFVLTQAETNGDALLFTAKSSTANISVVGQQLATTPASWNAFVTPTGAAVNATVAGLTFTVPGKADVNVLAVNGTTVTGNGHSGTEWGPV